MADLVETSETVATVTKESKAEPSEIGEDLANYFLHYQNRSPLTSRKAWLEKTIKGWCMYNKIFNIDRDGIVVDAKPRTTNRLSQVSIPVDLKEKYTTPSTSVFLVPWDNSTNAYFIPEIPFDNADEEYTDDYENYNLLEIVKFANELIDIKALYSKHDKHCKFYKEKIMAYLSANDLTEVRVGEFGCAIQKRVSMRFNQMAFPLELKVLYTKKTHGYSWTFYRKADYDKATSYVQANGFHLLKPTVSVLYMKPIEMDITD